MANQTARPLTETYALLKRSGFLETWIGSRFFATAYFLYKRYLADDLKDLVAAHPELVRGGNVVDVGANLGYTADVLARAMDAKQRLYAFEPESFNYAILRRIAARRRYRNQITPVQAAVGAEEGTIELWENVHHHADHRVITEEFRSQTSPAHRFQVPLVSIDEFIRRNPGTVSFIKIDVQGFELPVCQGMAETLERNPDIAVVLEYSPSLMVTLGFVPGQLLQFFVDRKFECYTSQSKGKLKRGLPGELKEGEYIDLLFTRRPIRIGDGA